VEILGSSPSGGDTDNFFCMITIEVQLLYCEMVYGLYAIGVSIPRYGNGVDTFGKFTLVSPAGKLLI
jgi:hypothetical protein